MNIKLAEALNMIMTLERENEELKESLKQYDWIPIQEQKPNPEEVVELTVILLNNAIRPFFCFGFISTKGNWFEEGSYRPLSGDLTVTHWRKHFPMPSESQDVWKIP